jgi:hypothetical protein
LREAWTSAGTESERARSATDQNIATGKAIWHGDLLP